MLIDYIYLILILVLIAGILFFINISYEYRQDIDGVDTREPFINPQINQLPQGNNNYQSKLSDFLNNYDELLTNTYNRQMINDNSEYQKLNQQFASNLNDTVTLLKIKQGIDPIPQTFPIDKVIKTIKSNYNSQYLSVFPNDTNKNRDVDINTNRYGILVNDKCMTVNGLCKDEFCLQQCQNNLYTTDSQKFYTDRINSSDDITRIMKIPKEKVSSKNIYPFNIFRSKVNDKCLSINNDGLSVEKCNLNNIQQQWSISPDENICLLS
jgi:hypothetical protein